MKNKEEYLNNELFFVGIRMLLIMADDKPSTTIEDRQAAARTIEELIRPYL